MEQQRGLMRGGVKLRNQAPVRIRWCDAEDPLRLEAWCKERRPGCHGEVEACLECGFEYCAGHMDAHVKRLSWPPDGWKATLRALVKEARNLQPQGEIKPDWWF